MVMKRGLFGLLIGLFFVGFVLASGFGDINFPVEGSYYDYGVNSTNWTLSGSFTFDSCWYSIDGGSEVQVSCYDNATSFSDLSDGNHTVVLKANSTDFSGTQTVDTVNFNVDTTNPVANITSPLNTSYGSIVSQIDYDYSDANLESCWYSTDGGANNLSVGSCDGDFTGVGFSEGDNTWTVYINDSAGNEASDFVTFWVDSISPNLTYVSPSSNVLYTNQDIFTFQFWLNETNRGDYPSASFSPFFLNVYDPFGANFENPNLANLSSSEGTYSEIKNVSPTGGNKDEGNYTWIVYSKDIYPNGSTIREVNLTGVIVRDTIAPSVTIDSPSNNDNLTGSVSINVSSVDERSGINLIEIIVDGSQVGNCPSSPCGYIWDSTGVSDGTHNITSTSTDRAGNSNISEISVEVDNTNPNITFNSPAAGINNTNQTINISAADVHLTLIELYVNGSVVANTNGTELPHTLTEGVYSVYAKAYDSFGNTNQTETRNITVDLTPPSLTNDSSLSSSVFSPGDDNGILDDLTITMNASELIEDWGTTRLYNSSGDQVKWFGGTCDNEISCVKTWDGKDTGGTDVPDGNYTINTTMTDSAGNTATVYVGSVIVDNTAPVLGIIGDNPQTINVSDSYTELGANATDSYDGNLNSSVVVDSSAVNTSAVGSYSVVYNVSDSAGNNATESRTVNVVDVVAPVINLTGDNPHTIELGASYSELNATASDNYDGDLSSSIIINSSLVNTNAVGSYNVSYYVQDSSGNNVTELRTVNVSDTTSPLINLILQDNNKAFGFGSSVFLEFNSTDLSSISNLTLVLDGVVNETISSINQGLNYNSTLTSLNAGRYNWTILARDSLNNLGTSDLRYFTILENVTFGDNTTGFTNLSGESDISNVSNFYVSSQYGVINWSNPIDFSSGSDWGSCINMSENSIEVNSSCFSGFNSSAVITIYNLTWSDPQILKDGSTCSDCTEVSYSAGTFVFSVTGFSVYSTQETPTSSGGGGGGGGGGSSTTKTSCTAEWSCTAWSSCANGVQTRTCTNLNSCENGASPIQTQSCIASLPTEEDGETSTDGGDSPEEEASEGFIAGITGAAVGTKGRAAVTLTLMVLLILGGVYFTTKHIKSKRRPKGGK